MTLLAQGSTPGRSGSSPLGCTALLYSPRLTLAYRVAVTDTEVLQQYTQASSQGAEGATARLGEWAGQQRGDQRAATARFRI